ncbi:hypothetical protein [Rhodococcoides kroppenstedtii]|uniref:hypothetical protein n=1 Tax=Rhodococcoides kroppenstedtii TaxID=293050 RepID=UPI003624C82F
MTAPDPSMEAITAAVVRGRGGDVAGARSDLEALWSETGVGGDPFHRCTLAHYLADLNLADNLRRSGSFPAAADHLDRAEERLSALPDDAYGDMIRSALTELRRAVAELRTERLSTAPDS